MSFITKLFSPSTPEPAPLPISPLNDGAAEKARQDASAASIAEGKANGRRATIAGGARGALESRQADQARKVLG